MNLTWSHTVLNVRNLDEMIAFYEDVLGFHVSDRGPVFEGGPEIVFLTQEPGEHHQIAMMPLRQGDAPPNSLNHMAFRTDSFATVQALHAILSGIEGANPGPMSHGNTLSVYFQDPEGNGIEVFWDTPWHVPQPQGKPWDVSMSESEALAWVEENFGNESGFEPKSAWLERMGAPAG